MRILKSSGRSSLLLLAAMAMVSNAETDILIFDPTETSASPSELATFDTMNMTLGANETMAPTFEEEGGEQIREDDGETPSPTTPTSSSGSVSITIPAPTTPAPVVVTPSPTQAPVTVAPTEAPTTPLPTDAPTTPAPTNSPTSGTRDCTVTPVTQSEVDTVRSAIANLIEDSDVNLRAKFVRLSFHDCVGGCDGCVDMTDPENAGLEVPIQALDPIVAEYETECLSRADIWALAGLVGADMAQDQVDFPLTWVGRQNCGAEDPMAGPFVLLPSAQLDVHGLLAYFDNEFGFDAQQVVALMGAHSIGRVEQDNSGFVGRGWDNGVERMDNGYYAQLIGPDEGVNNAPPWRQVFETHYQWAGGRGGGGGGGGGGRQLQPPGGPGGNGPGGGGPGGGRAQAGPDRLIMLNVDIALVRDFSGHLDTETGEVACLFREGGPGGPGSGPGGPPQIVERQGGGGTLCPVAAETFALAQEYRNDNNAFLSDFQLVFSEMLVHGYDVGAGCDTAPCRLPSASSSISAGGLRGVFGWFNT